MTSGKTMAAVPAVIIVGWKREPFIVQSAIGNYNDLH